MRQQSPLELWMRTGLWPQPEHERVEHKFNPWHDPEDGRFTFAGQGRYFGRGGSQVTAPLPAARRARAPAALAGGPSPRAMRAQIERIAREGRERDAFRRLIVPEEGDRDDVYLDSRGYPTVGIGHKLPDSYRSRVGERITAAQKEAFWRADADRALSAARAQMREANISDQNFLGPLASVNFQSGAGWYRRHKKTWALIKARQYAAAAREVQNGRWYQQTPKRVRAFQTALLRLERAEQTRKAEALRRGRSR